MRPPKNQIIEDLYTRGNEFLIEDNYANYSGYYHSQGGVNHIGAKYNPSARTLVPYTKDKINTAFDIYNIDATYFALNPNILNVIKQDNFQIERYTYSSTEGPKQRYFIKQKNRLDAPILEVTKDSYINTRYNPFYQTTAVYWDLVYITNDELSKIENELPGVISYLDLS
jgi:hypothetical protein